MFVFGHTGITLGCYVLLKKEKQDISYKKLFFVSVFALMPDLIDRGIHYLIPSYPDHGLFHSIIFYCGILPILFLFFKQSITIALIMVGNVVLDIANNNVHSLIYPICGWSVNRRGPHIPSPVMSLLDQWPETVGFKLQCGHYFLFEAIGGVIICYLLIQNARKQYHTEALRHGEKR